VTNGRVEHHKDLEVWQRVIDLVSDVYVHSATLPPDERFGLTSQMRRAAVSVAANIAEGAARVSSAEFARFVSIARGSLAELETLIHVARRLNLAAERRDLAEHITVLRRMLINLHRALSAKR
jgi:four helix bundle protein